VVGVWWWIVIAAFTLARIPCYPFYVMALAPLTAVLASGAFDPPSRRPGIARALAGWRVAYVTALLGLTLVTGAWISARGGAAGDYGVAFAVRQTQAQSIVSRISSPRPSYETGEARDDATLSCHGVPPELSWIVRWLDPDAARKTQSLALCDDWVEQNGKLVYRWTLRE
jgi:hypothetical protein